MSWKDVWRARLVAWLTNLRVWFRRLPCRLLGHRPIMEAGRFKCEACHAGMDYRDSWWIEVEDEQGVEKTKDGGKGEAIPLRRV